MLDESSPTNGDRMMGFAGMERDTVTGLNLAVNRVQNPGTGRWTSQDPLGFAAGDANLYRYARDSPVESSDPLGLQPPNNDNRDPPPGDVPVSPIKWIKNPTNTLVLVGPPLKDDQGDADTEEVHGKVTVVHGQGKIPPNNYIPFNGLNDLKTKTQPYKGQGKIIWIWVHGRPGGILIGSGPGVNEPLDLNNPKEYQALLGVLKALNPSEVHFWGCNVMGKIGEKPTGNNALKNLQNDLGGIPLTAPIQYLARIVGSFR